MMYEDSCSSCHHRCRGYKPNSVCAVVPFPSLASTLNNGAMALRSVTKKMNSKAGGGVCGTVGLRHTALPRHRVCARLGSGHAEHAAAAAWAWGACGIEISLSIHRYPLHFPAPPAALAPRRSA
jgi:hypothetical protein